MKFWAIAYLYQEDVWYDFGKNEDSIGLKETCLLPTKTLAETVIEEVLNDDYITVEIDILTVNKGAWSWTREQKIPRWDDY